MLLVSVFHDVAGSPTLFHRHLSRHFQVGSGSWTPGIQLHFVPVPPEIQRTRYKLRAIVRVSRSWYASNGANLFQNATNHVVACQTLTRFDCKALTTEVINERQETKPVP